MATTRLRRRTTAVAAALGLAAAACGGGADTTAPEPADASPPTTTAAAPETTAAPAPATTLSQAEECAEEGADDAALAAEEAREIMDAGPSGLGLQRLDQLRGEARRTLMAIAIGCPGGWGPEDEDRYQAIIAAAQEPEAGGAETGDETPRETADETGPDETGGGEAATEQAPAPVQTTAPAGPAPDDPAWVDELPEPTDPDPAPVGAVLDWDEGKLRPVEEGWPYVCEHTPYNCGPEGRWTWGPMAVTIGTRALSPGYLSPEPLIYDGVRSRGCPQTYRWTVTGFAPSDVGPGGLRSVRILLTQDTDASGTLYELADVEPVDPMVGCAEAPECPGPSDAVRCVEPLAPQSRPTSALAAVLPEHAETITCLDGQPAPDEDDPCPTSDMTGATLLVFFPPPRIG